MRLYLDDNLAGRQLSQHLAKAVLRAQSLADTGLAD